MTSSCLICKADTNYYFSKKYTDLMNTTYPKGLKVDYHKCINCGFVLSKTHTEMTADEWSHLNDSWHHHFEQNIEKRITNQPPYADQALALMLLSKNGLINMNSSLDYAAGYGRLANLLKKYFNENIMLFDKYVQEPKSGFKYVPASEIKKYKLVINSAMFEHILTREDLDFVNRLVDFDGVLMLHTVVCQRVPDDPDWFYLTPIIHTAFHTNTSMEILMKQWGYAASLYSPQAKSWFLFKKDSQIINNIESISNNINRELQKKFFYYKKGFVDYWKGF